MNARRYLYSCFDGGNDEHRNFMSNQALVKWIAIFLLGVVLS